MEKSENKIVVIECSGKEEQAIRQIEQIDVKGGKDKGIIIVDSEKDPKIAGAIGSSVPGCPSRSKILAEGLAMVALSMAAMSGILPRKLFPTERDFKKCLLPECETLTTHNGGYCCAEHCNEHKRGRYKILQALPGKGKK